MQNERQTGRQSKELKDYLVLLSKSGDKEIKLQRLVTTHLTAH